jgi:fermentation-respiration switch protein FrsA (DUF1100 family)
VRPTARFRRNAIALLLFGLFAFMFLRWFEYKNVYQPRSHLDAEPSSVGRPFEDVRFTSPDGVRLHGWFFPARGIPNRPNEVFLICHGNGGNISHRLDLYQALLSTGAAVLAFDYRGYGQSEGRPSEEGTVLDAQAALAWLRTRGFAASHVIAYGESLGGGIATELSVREPVGALVLQSTFTSIPDLGAEIFPWLPVRTVSRIKYDTHAKLPRLRVPLLIFHSRADTLIPFHHAENNFSAAREPKQLVELTGDHNDAVGDSEKFAPALEAFLSRYFPSGASF